MAFIIIKSIGDFQIRPNVLPLSFSERESGKWPLGLSDFYHLIILLYTALWKDIHLQHLIKTFVMQQHDFLCLVSIKPAVIRACSIFNNISVK